MFFSRLILFNLALALVLSSCTTNKTGDEDVIDIGGNRYKNSQIYTINSTGGVYKIGNPYKIFGTWYHPKEDYKYSEVGIASWYGSDFHAKATANGEKYDMNTLTAAHRTLPLPSIVKVTNLENGRSLILRVNDRGPYAKNRIIDISKKGAEILGFKTKGTAKVKVEIMPDESKKLKDAMLNKSGGDVWMKANKGTVIEKKEEVSRKITGDYVPQYVQAGSFANYETARNLKNQLKKFGRSFVSPVTVNGSKFYRVRLGPYRHEDEAKNILDKIKDYGIYNAKIVTK